MFYHYGSFKCLDNVNITIEKGKKYAVVGVSGSGKSTLLKILANLLNDYQGEVSFNLSSTQNLYIWIKIRQLWMEQSWKMYCWDKNVQMKDC